MAVNTRPLLLSRLNFVSQVPYSVLKACKWRKKDWIWVTLMLSSVTPLHLLRPETQGTLSSINEENVPVGLVFVKPNYIHSVGKVRINLSNPFWMCRMLHTVSPTLKITPLMLTRIGWAEALCCYGIHTAGRDAGKLVNMLTAIQYPL